MLCLLGAQPNAAVVRRSRATKHAVTSAQPLRSRIACQRIGRPRVTASRSSLICRASSARADEPHLIRQRPQPWNYKLGAVYQHLLPGPLLFLPSLLQPISTIISLEGAAHGHEWVHWLLSLLPVPQVNRILEAWLRTDST